MTCAEVGCGLAVSAKGLCLAHYKKAYREANKDKIAAAKKLYYVANKERLAAEHKLYYETNKVSIAAAAKVYRKANREAALEYGKIYCESNRKRLAEYYKINPEVVKASQSRRRASKKVSMSKEDRTLSVEYRKAIKNDPCFYCGTREGTFHDDHYIPLSKGGTDHWWNLVRACAFCNLSKKDKMPKDFLQKSK